MSNSEAPAVSVDYAFIGVKQHSDAREDVDEETQSDKEDETIQTTALVGRDAKSKVFCAISVPQEGIDIEEW